MALTFSFCWGVAEDILWKKNSYLLMKTLVRLYLIFPCPSPQIYHSDRELGNTFNCRGNKVHESTSNLGITVKSNDCYTMSQMLLSQMYFTFRQIEDGWKTSKAGFSLEFEYKFLCTFKRQWRQYWSFSLQERLPNATVVLHTNCRR